MLLRNRKKDDANEGKWIGVGGKLERGESPEECCRREVLEETGLTVGTVRACGEILFVSDRWETETMYLFHSPDFTGEPHECDEGTLHWIPVEDIPDLSLWEGDRLFLPLIRSEKRYFRMTLVYKGDELVSHSVDVD